MKERVITGICIGVVCIPILLFSEYIIYPIFLGLLSVLAIWELLRVLGCHKLLKVALPSYLLGGVLPIFAYKDFFSYEKHADYLLIVATAVFAYLLYLAAVCVFEKETYYRKDRSSRRSIVDFGKIASVFMAVTYVSVSFSAMSLTRYIKNGEYVFAMVFIAAWSCDIFAYFTGRLFGKHKLAPHLSPKKTIEGSIGGIIFAILSCLLYGFIIHKATGLESNYFVLGVIGLLLSVFSQIGDLFASLIKREYGIKDYSNIMPGHGGIMDRFDSILSISSILLLICIICAPFN